MVRDRSSSQPLHSHAMQSTLRPDEGRPLAEMSCSIQLSSRARFAIVRDMIWRKQDNVTKWNGNFHIFHFCCRRSDSPKGIFVGWIDKWRYITSQWNDLNKRNTIMIFIIQLGFVVRTSSFLNRYNKIYTDNWWVDLIYYVVIICSYKVKLFQVRNRNLVYQ